jgi:CRISPR type III-B/RAMP module RAMP protein Cmr6
MSSLLHSTREALGGDELPLCTSRSLRLTRYAAPTLKDKARQNYLARVVAAKDQRHDDGLASWKRWLDSVASPDHLIHARLESRLLVNMGGTVLENAGLQLDRFGIAYLPGSAVKACARRTALLALRQWCESGIKPTDDGDALAAVVAPFAAPADLLLAILRVFGCTDLEWIGYDRDEHQTNDLAWACADQWPALRDAARTALAPAVVRRGLFAFLPAYPIQKRPAADLETDVLTPHHKQYYEGKIGVATDDEDPVPVCFPAVAAGAIYTFPILPVGAPSSDHTTHLPHAKTWLLTGLTLLGIGAKTAAGYGAFADATAEIAARAARDAETRRRAEAEAAEKARHEAELAARKAREAARANMTPEQRADDDLATRAADWGWMKQHLTKFATHSPEAQAALLRWFCGAGRERWLQEIKPGAAKGKKPWSQIIGAIHAAKKAHKIDLP